MCEKHRQTHTHAHTHSVTEKRGGERKRDKNLYIQWGATGTEPSNTPEERDRKREGVSVSRESNENACCVHDAVRVPPSDG